MDHCQKQRIKVNTLHGALSLAGGVFCGFLLGAAATRFGWDITPNQTLLVSALVTVIGWFTSKPMFAFTEECMTMKKGRVERPTQPVKSNPPLNRLGTARPAAAVKTLKSPAECPIEMTQGGKLFDQRGVVVTINKTESGRTVLVSMKGASSSQFKGNNGARARLESIPGIKWSFPKNDTATGVRTIEGTIAPTAANEKVAASLIEICSRLA